MTIQGWATCLLLSVIAAMVGVMIWLVTDSKAIGIAAAVALVILIFAGHLWYFNFTASGSRAKVDERAELLNGLNRTITIYTADGTILKQYEGRIDIEQDQGYVKFDWDGKRYIYYNCYVETIADID